MRIGAIMRVTPLIDLHKELGASIGEFAGVQTALDFGNPVEEHIATRNCAAVFDLSHMGRIIVEGLQSIEFLDRLIPKDLAKSKDMYMFGPTAFLNERAGFVDDVMLYRLSESTWLIVCNAINVPKVISWLRTWKEKLKLDVSVKDITKETAMIALQGPKSLEFMESLGIKDVTNLKHLQFISNLETPFGKLFIVSRSGWTGEDGFELIGDPKSLSTIFKRLIELGARPAGLIARDSLRIEMGFCLYGAEIDEDITPIEARYWVFDIDKQLDYVGKDALMSKLLDGVSRVRLGIRMKKNVRFVPRKGYRVYVGDREIGFITSGTYSPILNRSIAQAYIESHHALPGLEVEVNIRGRRYRGKLVDFPFIKK